MSQAHAAATEDAPKTDVSAAASSYVAPRQPRKLITPPRHFMQVQMYSPAHTKHPLYLVQPHSPPPPHRTAATLTADSAVPVPPCVVCAVSTFTPALETVTALIFRAVLTESVKSLFGVVGAGMFGLDVLSFDAATSSGLVSIDSSHVVPVRSSFALCASTDGSRQCHIRVLQSSAFLASLAVDSRRWQLEVAYGK